MSECDFPVAVVVQRQMHQGDFWAVPEWRVESLLYLESQAPLAAPQATVLEQDERRLRVLWRGIKLRLHKDECASYWVNLLSEQPKLYVVCAEDEMAESPEEAFWPAHISADYDEASAYFEGEAVVCSCPMPEQLIPALEAYVLTHYQPQAIKKRQRKNWKRSDDR